MVQILQLYNFLTSCDSCILRRELIYTQYIPAHTMYIRWYTSCDMYIHVFTSYIHTKYGTYMYKTFEILYMNICTCHIQCHTTYIILYTLYMSIYALYIVYLNITVPPFFNSQGLSGHISSCQQVSSHKLCKYIAIAQLLLNRYKPVHPFQMKV